MGRAPERGTLLDGALYVVAVPIGNLEDVTLRALRVLRGADRIACEDTRQTAKLLDLLALPRRPLITVHDHNEAARVDAVLSALAGGEAVALVSDAGTPAISDPGYRVVRAAIDAGYPVVPIPGVSALTAAICVAGLPTDAFRFVGFMPAKSSARRQALSALATARETLVFYESPHRLTEFLSDARATFGPTRPAVIARELTKRFEEFRRGSLQELAEDPGTVRGEIVVLVGGAPPEVAPDPEQLGELVERLLAAGATPTGAAKEAARLTGARREDAYLLAVAARRRLNEAEDAIEP